MIRPEAIDALHAQTMQQGLRLLQPFRFGRDDAEHVATLLAAAQFPEGARVLDIGCGIGECARLMAEQRPDLRFTLLNFSAAQLKDCPPGMDTVLADAHALPFANGRFDAVMFHAALGNMDAMVALAEASRVLKPGGILFLNEIERYEGDNTLMDEVLQFQAFPQAALAEFAAALGLTLTRPPLPPDCVFHYLAAHWETLAPGQPAYEEVFAGTRPALWRLEKGDTTPLAAQYGSLFHRHQKVALNLSGGKDSLALLHAFRPWWDRLCVYWLNPGNPFPETVEFMQGLREVLPHFKEIPGRQPEVIAAAGWPADVVPHRYTTDGNAVFGVTPFQVQSRLSCCIRSLMQPAYEALVADGVTCCLRGKRAEEADQTGLKTGYVTPDGIELVFPLYDWTGDEVFAYLKEHGIELPPFYRHASHSLDCMDCTAWWGEGLSRYLKAEHPAAYDEYRRRVLLIKNAVAVQLAECEV